MVYVCLLSATFSCSNDDTPAPIDVPTLQGTITFGDSRGALLDITEEDMTKAGFAFGDVVSIAIENSKVIEVPYYDGFYCRNGEMICVVYNTPLLRITVCNGSMPEDLSELAGHTVVIKMKEKGGRLDMQEAMSMKYSINREDFPHLSDAEYANARVVKGGNIAEGKLHRCSSPYYNSINRAFYVSAYLESQQVKTLLNLADTIKNYALSDMPLYSRTLWEGVA